VKKGAHRKRSRIASVSGVTGALVCLVTLLTLHGCARAEPVTEPALEPIPDRSTKLYSQFNEELIIRGLIDDRRGGFFVDVGSYHWKDMSTTYFLEKHLGWSGIAVDAQAELAAGYAENRASTKFFGYAVTEKSGEVLKLYLAFGASSLDPNWLKRLGQQGQSNVVVVPTITLGDLLAREGVTRIDFLSIDVEGSEPRVLAGFDIENYMPFLVCIAVVANHDEISAYFEAHGYEHIYGTPDPLNWYFRPKFEDTRRKREFFREQEELAHPP